MKVSAVCLERLAERRPKQLVVRLDGRWRPVRRVGSSLMPGDYPQNRTVYLAGNGAAFVEEDTFDVRLRADG